MANEDIVGSMAKLEALRQNALMRNQIKSEGMLEGGRSAGRQAGTAVGGTAGAALIYKMLQSAAKFKGGLGKGLTAATAIGSGTALGRFNGNWMGGALANRALPKLPDHMQSPVTLGSAPQVSATLAKAAADTMLISRMEKTASVGLVKGLGAGLKWLGGKQVGGNQYSAMSAAKRIGGTVVAPFGATVGAAHLDNDAENTAGTSFNPLRWFSSSEANRPKPELYQRRVDIYNNNNARYDAATKPLRDEMEKARLAGDTGKYAELEQKLQAGNFRGNTGYNPLNYHFWGLNPWSDNRDQVSTMRQHMLTQQQAMQSELDGAIRRNSPQPGDADLRKQLQERLNSSSILPYDAEQIRRQLQDIATRQSGDPTAAPDSQNIRRYMDAARMHVVAPGAKPGQVPVQAGAAKPYGAWLTGGRTRSPGYAAGAAMMPSEFRPYPQPWDYTQSQESNPGAGR